MLEHRAGKKARKNGVSLISVFTAGMMAIISVFILIFDKGPLLPPFPDDFESIDCEEIALSNFTDDDGRIIFTFSAKPSIEYPPEYLPNFISISITTLGTMMSYSGDEMIDITRNDSMINFSVAHAFAGPSLVEMRCLNQFYDSFETELTNIKHYIIGSSRSENPKGDIMQLKDSCLEYDKFLFFTRMKGNRTSVDFNHGKFRFEFLDMVYDEYVKYKNVTKTTENAYFITSMPSESWKAAVFWAAPIANSVENHPGDKTLFVMNGEPPPQIIKPLRRITKTVPVNKSEIMCFNDFHLTRSMSEVDINKDEDMNNVVHNYTALRKYFVNEGETKGIVIGDELGNYRSEIMQAFPNQTVVVLRKGSNSLMDSSEKCGNAAVLIGTHISSLAHSIWMPPNSTVIDASPAKIQCNPWVSNLAKDNNLSYIPLNKGRCECSTFSCYPKEPASKVNVKALIDAIAKVLPKEEAK